VRSAALQRMQQTYGNRAVQRYLKRYLKRAQSQEGMALQPVAVEGQEHSTSSQGKPWASDNPTNPESELPAVAYNGGLAYVLRPPSMARLLQVFNRVKTGQE
jgi:hypothetical protein